MLKKAKIAILLAMAFVFALQGIGLETAEAAVEKKIWTADEVIYANLLEGLDEAAATGIVAEVYNQSSHSEANVIADKVIRRSDDPFLISGRANASMPFNLVVSVELPIYHLADTMTFGLYTKNGDDYTYTGISKTVNVEGKEEVEVDFGRITDDDLRFHELYVFQIEQGNIVEEGTENSDNMTPEYGPPATTGVDGVVYIGSMEYALQQNGRPNKECKIFQKPDGDYSTEDFEGTVSRVEFGPTIQLYKLTNDGYVPLPDSHGKVYEDGNLVDSTETMTALDKVYIRDTSWSSDWDDGGYFELVHVTHNGSSYMLYGEHEITITYEKAGKAKELLDDLANLSYNLANSRLGIGGTSIQGPGGTPLTTGGSTTTGTITDGKVVSLYTVPVENNVVQARKYLDADSEKDGSRQTYWTNKGLPIAENEYIVINVVVPEGTEYIDFTTDASNVSLYNGNGDIDKHGDWGNGDPLSFGRLIWNPVTWNGSEYVPYTGKVFVGGGAAGIYLAPNSVQMSNSNPNGKSGTTANACTLISREVYQGGQEIHQTSFDSSSTYVRMTNKPAIEMKGTKRWNDEGNEDKRPKEIKVELYASMYRSSGFGGGVWEDVLVKTFTVDADDNWSWTVEGLPKAYNGKNIGYWVKEIVDFDYYTFAYGDKVFKKNGATVAGENPTDYDEIQMDLINTYDVDSIAVKGQKIWEDGNNQDGKRPASITVQIQGSFSTDAGSSWSGWKKLSEYPGFPGYDDTITVDAGDDWSWVFENLKKTYYDGSTQYDWQYRVVETKFGNSNIHEANELADNGSGDIKTGKGADTGYDVTYSDGYNITNSYTPEKTQLSGTKVWQPSDVQNKPEVRVNLYINDNGTLTNANKSTVANESTGWKWSFTDLDKYTNDGSGPKEIVYEVKEDEVPGFWTEYAKNDDGTITIYNIAKDIKLNGQKIWKDQNGNTIENYSGQSITIEVYREADNKLMLTKEVNQPWSWSVELPGVDPEGNPAEYYVEEVPVPNYTTSVDKGETEEKDNFTVHNWTVTNQYKPISIKVTKVWADDNNLLGMRPDQLNLYLKCRTDSSQQWQNAVNSNGQQYSAVLNVANGETEYTFTDLPEFDTNGNKYEYYVEELTSNWQSPFGYTQSYETTTVDQGNIEYTLTNTIEKTQITGTKTWSGLGLGEMHPTSITLNIYSSVNNSEPTLYTTKEISGGARVASWNWTITGLPKYSNVNGQTAEVKYTIEEVPITGYNSSVSGDMNSDFVVANTKENRLGRIRLYKESATETEDRTVNGELKEGVRKRLDGAVFKLYADENCTQEVTIGGKTEFTTQTTGNGNNKESGKLTIENVPYGTYWLKEVKAPDGYVLNTKAKAYKVVVNGSPSDVEGDEFNQDNGTDKNVVLNYKESTGISVTVSKVWNHDGNPDDTPPTTAKVQLLQNGEKYGDPVTVDGSYKWENLLKVDDDNEPYVYTVRELEIPLGYASELTATDAYNYTLTNTYIGNVEFDFSATKMLEGGTTDEDFTFQLYATVSEPPAPMPTDATMVGNDAYAVKTTKGSADGKTVHFTKIILTSSKFMADWQKMHPDDTSTGPYELEYKWSVKEVVPDQPNPAIKYDENIYEHYITVVLENDQLKITEHRWESSTDSGRNEVDAVKIAPKSVFTNKVTTTSVQLEATKELENGNLSDKQFDFSLTDTNGEQNKTYYADCDAAGKVTFNEMQYTLADMLTTDGTIAPSKTFYYWIQEGFKGNVTTADGKHVYNGIVYDNTQYTAVVTVTYNEQNHKLTSAVKYYPGQHNAGSTLPAEVEKPSFTNTKVQSVKVSFAATKWLNGALCTTADAYTFKLTGPKLTDGVTATNGTEGAVSFAEVVEFTLDDLVYTEGEGENAVRKIAASKEFVYTLEEVVPEGAVNGILNGVVYDATKYTAKVTVSYANGVLSSAVKYYKAGTTTEIASDKVVFNNTVVEDTQVSFEATKQLNGTACTTADAYTFKLTGPKLPEDGITATNGADGAVSFANVVTYTLDDLMMNGLVLPSKEFTYTLEEVVPAGATNNTLNGVTYDGTKYTAKVTVSYADGVLSSAVKYYEAGTTTEIKSDEVVFNNIVVADTQVSFAATKMLNGTACSDGKFNFMLHSYDNLLSADEVATNGQNGMVSFSPVTIGLDDMKDNQTGKISSSKTFRFDIGECVPGGSQQNSEGKYVHDGVIYDNTYYTALVTVTYNAATHTLTAGEPEYYKNYDPESNANVRVDDAVFNNATAKGSIQLNVEKCISGRDFQAGDTFTFTLSAKDGAPMPAQGGKTLTLAWDNDNSTMNQSGSFGVISYDLADVDKTYTYIVKEKTGTLPNMTYDTTEHKVTVKVEDKGDGTLTVTADYGTDVRGAAMNTVEITNTYAEQSVSATLTLGKTTTLYEITEPSSKEVKVLVSPGENNPATCTLTQPATVTINLAKASENQWTGTNSLNITFTDEGTYTFDVCEMYGDKKVSVLTEATYPDGMLLDASQYTIKFPVKMVDGVLTVDDVERWEKDDKIDGTPGAVFLNHEGTDELIVYKNWVNDIAAVRPDDLNLAIYYRAQDSTDEWTSYNGTITQSVEKQGNSWSVKISGLPSYIDGVQVEWSAVETPPAGYTATYKDVDDEVAERAEYAGTITNTYKDVLDASVEFSAKKNLENAELTAGAFSFELRDAAGNVLQTKTNSAEGTIAFDAIKYSFSDMADARTDDDGKLRKEINYTISEVRPEGAVASANVTYTYGDVVYDGTVHTVTAVLTYDAQKGVLEAKAGYNTEDGSNPVFTNTYIEKTYTLELEKADKLDPTKKLPGAVYTLYISEECEEEDILELPDRTKAIITTGEDGTGKLDNVPAGTYWVKETTAPEGYQVDPEAYPVTVPNAEDPSAPVQVAVKDYPETSVAVKKVWAGVPENTVLPEITVKLLADGVETGKTLVLNAANSWTGAFTGLDSYDEVTDKAIVYTVEEVTVAGYTTAITGDAEEGYTITNTLVDASVQFSAMKYLENAFLEESGFSFEFELRDAAGEVLQTKTNDADGTIVFDAIGYSIDDMVGAQTDENGMLHKEVNYTISEVIPEGAVDNENGTYTYGDIIYDGTVHTVTAVLTYDAQTDDLYAEAGYNTEDGNDPSFTNIWNGDKTFLNVLKVWEDNENAAGMRPETVTLILLADGVEINTAEVSEETEWQHIWNDLPTTNMRGEPIEYSVSEADVPGYSSTTVQGAVNPRYWNVINTCDEKTYALELEKADKLNPTKKLPGAVYTLYISEECEEEDILELPDGTKAIITTGEDGTGKLDNVPAGTYWVKETTAPEGYQVDPEAYPVTVPNAEDPSAPVQVAVKDYPETSVAVKKVWAGVPENTVLPEITVKLLADGKETGKTLVLNAANSWAGVFTGLDSYDEVTDKAIAYTVEEVTVAGYTTAITGDAAEGYTITNTYVTEEQLGKLMLCKSDRLNSGKKLAGAQYTLFIQETCKDEEILVLPDGTKAIITTGADGWGSLTGVPAGTYWVKETKAPVGYEVDPLAYKVVVEADAAEPVQVQVSDFPLRGALSLSKTVVADSKTGDSFLFDIVLSRTDSDPIVGSYEATLNGAAAQAVTFTADGTSAKATVALKDGETLVIHGLRAGTAYTVTEQPNALYDVQVNGVAATGATGTISDTALSVAKFQNTLKLTSFAVKKEWTGLAEGEKAPAIQLQLYCNGKAVTAVTPTPDQNGWYTYTGLPAYVNGEAAVYTVKEVPVTGFTTAYINKGVTGEDATECAYNGGTIVNSKIPQTGDNTPLALWMLTTLLAACGLLGVTMTLRKREN